jgi:hypothetical protein
MRPIEAIERDVESAPGVGGPAEARRLLGLAEEALECWIAARGEAPTAETREGFRLLALHHQGAHGVPSFNACRETCREIAYHYNLVTSAAGGHAPRELAMMAMLARHLVLFVGGKMQNDGLGEFCCASKPIRQDAATIVA